MKVFLICIFGGLIFWSCSRNTAIADSNKYYHEELAMYQQLIDVLLDSAGFDDVDPHNQVFNLTDTLYDIDTRDDRQDLLKIEIKRRAFSVSRLAVNSRHEFIKSKDRLTDRGDSIGTRLDLSRVRFNKEMNKGLLQIEISCGFLCGYGYQCQIEKIDGKWIVKNCRLLWIS